MATLSFQYTGTEAVDIIKNYYPQDWQQRLEVKKQALLKLANRQKITIEKAYRKFIIPVAGNQESLVFFAALSELLKNDNMSLKQKSEKVLQLEEKRELVANQIVAMETSNITSHEDKKILRPYYTKLQHEITYEINELINSFEVAEPQLIIYQAGLFD